MAFKAGAIYGEARLDTKKWKGGLKTLAKTAKIAMAAVAAAVVAYMVKAVKAADEFQRAMSNVATLLDTTKISTQDLAKQILQLNPALGKATELTNGLYQAFSAGAVTAKEAMQTTVDAAKFARAGLTDVDTAVDVLTTAVNAYGRATMNTTKASDIFFTTIKYGKITGEQLASSIGQVIPIFASAGIKLEELSAGMAAMTKQGINAHIATTQLKAIVSAFLKPSEDMKKALKDIGYESGSAFLKAEGLAGALELIEDASGGDAAAMANLLPNIRALTGAMALTGVGAEEFKSVLVEMGDAAGVTQVAFDKQEKTFDTLRNAWGKTQVVLGNIAKYFVDQVAAGATTASNSTLDFIMSNKGMEVVAQIAGYVSGGFTLIKEALVFLWDIWKKAVGPVFDTIKEVLGDVTGETNAGAGAMKIFSIAINIVATGMTVAGKVASMLIRLIGDMVIAVKESAEVVGEFFSFKFFTKEGRQQLKIKAQEAGEAFKNLGQNFVSNIGEIFQTVRDEVKEFSGETEELTAHLTTTVTSSYQGAKLKIESIWGELITGQAETTKGGVEDLRKTISDGTDEIEDDVEETGSNLKEIWKEAWNDMIDIVTEKFEFIKSVVQFGMDTLSSIGEQYRTNEEAENKIWYQNELAVLQKRFDNGLITEEQFNDAKGELDKTALEKENALKKKAFAADKINRIAGVAINAASAIMGWWASASVLGPFAGPIFAKVMTGLTLVAAGIQAASISQQKFVPSMATGGMVRVNEQGGEIITLPDNSQVIPNDISRQIASNINKTGTIINVSFEGAKISDEMDLEIITDRVITKIGREMRFAG